MTTCYIQPEDLGLWRFGIISPLLHSTQDDPALHVRIAELSQRTFYTPKGREKHLCPETIRNWLQRYRTCGIDGLRSRPRKDHGFSTVPLPLQQALTELRDMHPQWTVKRLLGILLEQGQWNGQTPSRSAVYRFTASHGLNRGKAIEPLPVRSFEFPFFGDLWSADFLHGPKVRCGTYAKKVYLHAIIDDTTRYIVVARFHFAEDTRSLLDDLMLAIRRFGIPKRLYTDNGAAFRSRHLHMVAAKIGIALPHTPPYTPRGRGKIERFFRSVRDGFLTGRDKCTLAKLNSEFTDWLTHYHNTQHTSLGMSPLNRKLADTGPALRQIAPTQNIDEIFLMEQIKKVNSDGCVKMFKRRFEVPGALPGNLITVYYLPWDEEIIYVGIERLAVKPLDTVKNALRFDKPQRAKQCINLKEKEQ
jgi:putative transposase